MINSINYGGNLKTDNISDKTKVYMGSWSSNFHSWKSFKSPGKYLLVKYEDLVNDKEKTFYKILNFIYKLNKSNLSIDKNKIKNMIETTSFKNMQALEKKEGFIESKINIKTGKKIPFFNLGPKNTWKNILDEEIRKKIEISFRDEMIELGYL